MTFKFGIGDIVTVNKSKYTVVDRRRGSRQNQYDVTVTGEKGVHTNNNEDLFILHKAFKITNWRAELE